MRRNRGFTLVAPSGVISIISVLLCIPTAGLTDVVASGQELAAGAQTAKKDKATGPNAPAATKSGQPALHITRWGSSGPTVILVHGGVQGNARMGGARHFATQQKLAERGWRIVVPDRPGHGQSPTRGPDNVVADAGWVAELLGDGAHLVGHSFGGAVALVAAARRPGAVRSLTLIEPALLQLAGTDPEVRAFQAKMVRLLTSGRPPQEIRTELSKLMGIPEEQRSGPATPKQQTVAGGLLQARMAPLSTLKESAATVAAARIPVLCVTGGWNPAFEATADAVVKLTNGRHVVIKSTSHFPHTEHTDAFNTLLNDFMHEADRARKPRPAGVAGKVSER